MARGIIERLIVGVLVLLGVDAPSSYEVAIVGVLSVALVLELVLDRRSLAAILRALLRALELPSAARPHEDVALLEALRAAGIDPQRIAEAWERERGR